MKYEGKNEHTLIGIAATGAHSIWTVGKTINVNGQSVIGDPHVPGPAVDALAMYHC